MDHANPLLQAFVFLAAAVISVPIAKRLGLGSVLGYLIAGALIGPFGLKFLSDPETVMHAAEFGVVIMLFLIGLEIQPALLWRMRAAILGLGGLQVLLAGLAIAGVSLALGLDWRAALAVGFILALSSTAIVLQSYRERGLDSAAPGRAGFAVLLFQDIAVIPMLALLPLLAVAHGVEAGHAGEAHGPAALAGLPTWAQPIAVLAAVAAIVVAGRFLVGPLFRFIARTGLREIFTATALALVVGVAVLMQTVGLSPALGAFVAGVVLADSEFRHELEGDIEPFRGLLLGLFFISVGASIDFALVLAQPLLIAGLVVALIVVKAAVLFALATGFGHGRADAALLALSLAQGGEFAFVLAAFAGGAGVLDAAVTGPLVAVVALSMAATPILFILAERLRGQGPAEPARAEEAIEHDKPHAIIAGFGRFGQVVSRILLANGFRTSVLDYSADQIDLVRRFGNRANYGDATRLELLHAAGAETAKILIIAIDDRDKALALAENARRHFPHLKILARAYDRRHAYELMKRGVDGFERETFGAGVGLGVKALRALGWPAHQAYRAGKIFARHDLRLFEDMAAYWGNDEEYRIQLRARSGDIERLLTRDLAVFHADDVDPAWDANDRARDAPDA